MKLLVHVFTFLALLQKNRNGQRKHKRADHDGFHQILWRVLAWRVLVAARGLRSRSCIHVRSGWIGRKALDLVGKHGRQAGKSIKTKVRGHLTGFVFSLNRPFQNLRRVKQVVEGRRLFVRVLKLDCVQTLQCDEHYDVDALFSAHVVGVALNNWPAQLCNFLLQRF